MVLLVGTELGMVLLPSSVGTTAGTSEVHKGEVESTIRVHRDLTEHLSEKTCGILDGRIYYRVVSVVVLFLVVYFNGTMVVDL